MPLYIKIGLLCLLLNTSCAKLQKKPGEQPLARVQDLFLYPSDLSGKFPAGISAEDSSKIARRLIEEWARERLLLKRAEQYLSPEEKNVTRQIEAYRLSLLTFKYKQNLLAQKLDTLITDAEIEKYYRDYSSNYILGEDVIKVTFVKVPVTAPQINQVRRWYRSENTDDLDQLEKYCSQYADRYIIKGNQWFRLSELASTTPLKIDNPKTFLSYRTNIEVSDSVYNYYIHIDDRVAEGQVSPIDLVKIDIRAVILNKRKLEFIQDLENTIYKDGLSRNQVEFF